MIKIFVQGLEDGTHKIEMEVPVNSIADISAEFFGNIKLHGAFRKHQQRFSFDCKVRCGVKLICDISLEEYEDTVEFEYKSSYIRDSRLFYEQEHRDLRDNEEKAFLDDSKDIDISDDIREELLINLPMKKIAPKYRNKSFEEIFPEYSNNKKSDKSQKTVDDRWAQLKKLKLN